MLTKIQAMIGDKCIAGILTTDPGKSEPENACISIVYNSDMNAPHLPEEMLLAQCRREDVRVGSNPAYELVDSGNYKKLERYGNYLIERPEPMALWKPRFDAQVWQRADLVYNGKAGKGMWENRGNVPDMWTVDFGGIIMEVRPWSFKHTGIFPEHQPHWSWIAEREGLVGTESKTMLNVFGYTGGASVAGAKAGFTVTHVDASKPSVAAAGDNARTTFGNNPLRLIVDDATAFVRREMRREAKYDALVLDPPSFGRGSKGQVWKIEEQLPDFLDMAVSLLSEKPSFILLNGYASGYSADTYMQVLFETLRRVRPELAKTAKGSYGDMSIVEKADSAGLARNLSTGMYARIAW